MKVNRYFAAMLIVTLLFLCDRRSDMNQLVEATFPGSKKIIKSVRMGGVDFTKIYLVESKTPVLVGWEKSDRSDFEWLVSTYDRKCDSLRWNAAFEFSGSSHFTSRYNAHLLTDGDYHCLIINKL